MGGNHVLALQKKLKELGVYDAKNSGYYCEYTEQAVIKFQSNYGLAQDGIAGEKTLKALDSSLRGGAVVSSRSSESRQANYLMSWFGGVNGVFARGTVATVYDVETGLSFKIKRTFGTNHADCETLTSYDTEIMKKVYGGQWSWQRRAVIVSVNGTKIAASMNGMPHAGLDKYSEGRYVSGRSGGYGYGRNYDAVKGNNMNGHFCVHFYKSRTHSTNRIDEKHQAMLKKAADWAKRNY